MKMFTLTALGALCIAVEWWGCNLPVFEVPGGLFGSTVLTAISTVGKRKLDNWRGQ
jgi:hypothetical protein